MTINSNIYCFFAFFRKLPIGGEGIRRDLMELCAVIMKTSLLRVIVPHTLLCYNAQQAESHEIPDVSSPFRVFVFFLNFRAFSIPKPNLPSPGCGPRPYASLKAGLPALDRLWPTRTPGQLSTGI
jgi:hypothetical protein